MINLFKSPFNETLEPGNTLYPVISERIHRWKASECSYVPLLLGVVRGENSSELLYNPQVQVCDKGYYSVDYYRYEKGVNLAKYNFTHVATVGKGEVDQLPLMDSFDQFFLVLARNA